MSAPPLAFLSYARFDDSHDNGKLRQFAERLQGEVRLQSGLEFEIFIDRDDIRWGQQWEARLKGALDTSTFLVPMITPGYWKSEWCRDELERFLEREKKLGRGDLILPVYYVRCPELERQTADALATVLRGRQYTDWRNLRHEPWTAPDIGRRFEQMAVQIVEALDRPAAPPPPTPPAAPPRQEATQAERPAQASSAYSRNEAPVLVVSQLHRGDGVTIGEVLKKAPAGAKILVQPGRYREGIVLDKPVEILGDGLREDIVVEVEGAHVVAFRTTFGRLANLTLRQLGGEFYAVDIAQGRLELDDCDISSRGLACVGVHNGADPRIRRNRIHGGGSAGVVVYENGLGVIEDNEIFGNALVGVAITEGANPTVRKNRIRDGKAGGVFVYEKGLGVIEDNEIFGNALNGVAIKEGANPTVRNNRIRDGKQCGVLVWQNGLGVIEDNEIFGNALTGVEVRESGAPIVRNNQIHDNGYEGIWIQETGRGTYENNTLTGNKGGAWRIDDEALPHIQRKDNIEK